MVGTVAIAGRGRWALMLIVLAAIAVPPAARAQSSPVLVDPDSPSGHEYRFPLEDARKTGTPAADRPAPTSGSGQAPLFGGGITPADGAGGAPASGATTEPAEPESGTPERKVRSKARSRSGANARAAKRDADSGPRESDPGAARPAAVYTEHGTSARAGLIAGGSALAVLLLGLLGYRLLARSSRQIPD